MNRRGMSLMELAMVVIGISLAASVALPLYLKAVEKVRGEEGLTTLRMLRAAEKIYYYDTDAYTVLTTATPGFLVTSGYVQNPNAGNPPFAYTVAVTLGPPDTFIATATRNSGCNNGETFTLTDAGVEGGTWSVPCP